MKTRARSDKSKVEFKSTQRKVNAAVSVPLPVSVPIIVETKSPPRRTPIETSPVRRRREISKHQDERMKLITKALDGYNDELSKLFEIATWKELIRKSKRGAPDERKYYSEEIAERTAKTIIEQIASREYVTKVGQILSVGLKRGKIGVEDRSSSFMLLASDFESRQTEGLWMRVTGRVDDSSSEQDDSPNLLNSSQENPTCVVLELVEGMQDLSYLS
jgi:hypothetical protein